MGNHLRQPRKAIFPAAVAVNLESSAAMTAHQWIDSLSLHEMQMTVPPLVDVFAQIMQTNTIYRQNADKAT